MGKKERMKKEAREAALLAKVEKENTAEEPVDLRPGTDLRLIAPKLKGGTKVFKVVEGGDDVYVGEIFGGVFVEALEGADSDEFETAEVGTVEAHKKKARTRHKRRGRKVEKDLDLNADQLLNKDNIPGSSINANAEREALPAATAVFDKKAGKEKVDNKAGTVHTPAVSKVDTVPGSAVFSNQKFGNENFDDEAALGENLVRSVEDAEKDYNSGSVEDDDEIPTLYLLKSILLDRN